MNRALFAKDLKELRKPRYWITLALTFLLFLGAIIYILRSFPNMELLMKVAGDLFLISMTGPIAFVLPSFFFLQMLFVEEKLSGSIQALLLTPLKPTEILFTKALLSTMISVLFILLLSLIVMAMCSCPMSFSLILFLFIILPLLVFSLSVIMGYLALGKLKPSAAMMVGAIMMIVVIQVNVWIPQVFSASQSILLTFYLALAAVLFPASIVMGRRLNREDVMRAV